MKKGARKFNRSGFAKALESKAFRNKIIPNRKREASRKACRK
jgi:hypothetical protein